MSVVDPDVEPYIQTHLKGKKNIYTCDKCGGHVVTVDLDAGVTPFMIGCRATDGCNGMMKSSMYRVFDQNMRADYAWYRPSEAEFPMLDQWSKDHVRKGGLLIRAASPDRNESRNSSDGDESVESDDDAG